MASISKRKYWADPVTGKEVKAGTVGAVQRTSRVWRIRYVDAAGKRVSAKGYVDKRATEQLAATLEAAAARGEERMVNRYQLHDRHTLAVHVAEYLRHLEVQARDDMYRTNMRVRLTRLMKECGWTRLRDITAESFVKWRDARVGLPECSGKTLNQWRDTLRAFLNWAASGEQRRIAENPIAGVGSLPHTPTFRRRALEPEHLEALYEGVPVERCRVYAVAVTTGLRRQELEDLEWGDVRIDAPAPFLALRAEATKARRGDVFALKPEIAELLRSFRPQEWAPEDKVFPVAEGVRGGEVSGVPTKAQLIADLRMAGVAVPDGDAFDRIDFHALRTTLGSFIGRAGIPERVGMELLRVTDPGLLRQTYCDPRILGTSQAAAALAIPTPILPPLARGPETARGQIRTALVVGDCRGLSVEAGAAGTVEAGKPMVFQGVMGEMSGVVGESRDLSGTGGLGFEPRTKGGFSSENVGGGGAAGPFSDRAACRGLSGGKGGTGGVRERGDAVLEALVAVWPRLSVAVRTSLLSLALAGAQPVGGGVGKRAAGGAA